MATIALVDPDTLNFASTYMIEELIAAFEGLATSTDVLAGNGRRFCSGVNVARRPP